MLENCPNVEWFLFVSQHVSETVSFYLALQAGKIRDIRIVKDLRGKSRGFCYVEYVNPVGAQEALKLDRQNLEGRPVFVSKYSKDNERETHFKGTGGEEKNKLFVRGLLTAVTKEDLTKVFEEVRLFCF